jgi:hypothetical protein
MDDRDLISRLQDLLAAERWANEGGRIAPDRVLDRERAEARRVVKPFSHQGPCEPRDVTRRGPAIRNIVDDAPAPARDWLPVLAEILGAKPPRHVPRWVARMFAGEAAVMMGTESRGASNEKAKRELGWTLRYPTWREGFAATYAASARANASTRRVVEPATTART